MFEPLIVQWNGCDLPRELERLPAGRYVAAPDDDLDAEHSRPFTALHNLKLGGTIAPADVLAQLAQLAPGQYLVEPADEPVELTPEEEAGIRRARDQASRGEVTPLADVRRDLRSRWARA